MNEVVHHPVLLKEVLELLSPKEGDVFVDFTLGGAGHFVEVLKLIGMTGRALGIDRDASALLFAKRRLGTPLPKGVHLAEAKFSEVESLLGELKFPDFDIALFDLGISSMQIASDRGFSFMKDSKLDMQMGRDKKTAFEVVNSLPGKELSHIIRTYGEEPLAGKIARAIENAREKRKIGSTLELVEIIDRCIPQPRRKYRNKILARTFQAIRICVNDEVKELEDGLRTAVRHLKIGGRLGVISYHSIEDRIVKRTFRFYSDKGDAEEPWVLVSLAKKPVTPTKTEIEQNPRARSAKLRVVEKTYKEVSGNGN